jgi:hypothetical protein
MRQFVRCPIAISHVMLAAAAEPSDDQRGELPRDGLRAGDAAVDVKEFHGTSSDCCLGYGMCLLRLSRRNAQVRYRRHMNVTQIAAKNHEERRDTRSCLKSTQVLSRIGDKWTVLNIILLRDRGSRFNELKRGIDGISQRMLTLTLRNMERDGW